MSPLSHLVLDQVPDQTPGSFNERELVRKAGLEQDAHPVVAAHIGCLDESHVLCDTQVNQMEGLGQDEKVLRRRRLDLGELLAELVDENVVKASIELHGLFADEFEALIESREDLI